MALVTLQHLRNVTWSSKYLWEVKFPNGDYPSIPRPFDDFFPAVDVEEDSAAVENHSFKIGHTEMSIPLRKGQKNIKITFVDDSKNVLFNWFKNWIDSIANRTDGSTATVKEAAREVQISKLDRDKTVLESKVYWVIPGDTKNPFNGNNENTVQTYSLNFIIVNAR